MKLSTRATYGLRAMMALSQEYGQGSILLKDIAERQRLPVTYLEQLMVPLRKSGLVAASRGVNGGYTLTRDPASIVLAEIILALEGPFVLVDCASIASCRGRHSTCALRDVLDGAGTLLTNYFQAITLEDITIKQLALDREPDAKAVDYAI